MVFTPIILGLIGQVTTIQMPEEQKYWTQMKFATNSLE